MKLEDGRYKSTVAFWDEQLRLAADMRAHVIYGQTVPVWVKNGLVQFQGCDGGSGGPAVHTYIGEKIEDA